MIFLTTDDLQWLGCATGAVGALLLALNTRYSGYGFVSYLISNAFWVAFAIETHANGLIAMQAIFTATSALGIYRWLISKPIKTALNLAGSLDERAIAIHCERIKALYEDADLPDLTANVNIVYAPKVLESLPCKK